MHRVTNKAKTVYNKVTHVIFDLDGLLLDTEPLYTQAIQSVLDTYGKTLTYPNKVEIMGMPGPDVAKSIVKTFDLPLSWEEYYALVRAKYPLLFPTAELLPDTESIYNRVFSDIATSYNRKYTSEVHAKVLGRLELEGAQIAVAEMKLPLTPQQFLEKYKSMAEAALATVGFMPGAEKLVRHLHQQNVPIAVATSSTKVSYDMKTQKHQELFKLFSHIVTAGSDPEVKHGKPSPDVFLVCASRFSDTPKPELCLVFEDAPNGVQAAVGAGMQVVMVPDPQTDLALCQNATVKLRSLEETPLEEFGLPPFN